jgi:hypothetical protein
LADQRLISRVKDAFLAYRPLEEAGVAGAFLAAETEKWGKVKDSGTVMQR